MNIDFHAIFINDLNWQLAVEIMLRAVVMFTLLLVFLRLMGKKGVRQLSLFEVAIIIGLGSAAGDPMFNQDHAILPALLVFVAVLVIYRLLIWLALRNERLEQLLEGKPVVVIQNGEFVLMQSSEQVFAKEEFFAEMRQQHIEHVGQVETAILETNGQVSFFYYADQCVVSGLPVWPQQFDNRTRSIEKAGQYACTYCGHVQQIKYGQHSCGRCGRDEWVSPLQTLRKS